MGNKLTWLVAGAAADLQGAAGAGGPEHPEVGRGGAQGPAGRRQVAPNQSDAAVSEEARHDRVGQ